MMTTPTRRPVRLRYRPVTRADLAECFELLPRWLGLDDALAAALPALWERLVDEPSMITGLLEDLTGPPGQRIQGWGVTLALPPAAVSALELEGEPRAFLARRVYAALHEGSLQPMSDREIGLANARGDLTLLILHYTQRSLDIADPAASSALALANDAFRAFHDGYNPRAIYFETSALQQDFGVSSGFDVLRFRDADSIASLPPERRPVYLGLTREQARSRLPGMPARNVFEHQVPLFRFSMSQRRLLWLALFDDSDEQLMRSLEVSVHGLKKLWRGIYERIEDQAPDFFGEAVLDNDGKRGPEKRRQVLAYVRQRLEEVRPWAMS